MKKICFAFNHFQFSDGIARSAIAIANQLTVASDDIEITIRPIFRMELGVDELLDPRVKIKPLFKFYFNGFSKVFKIIPDSLVHNIVFGKDLYDIEIGFQRGIATRAVASAKNHALHLAWMHGYDDSSDMIKYYRKVDKLICVSKCNANLIHKKCGETVKVDYCYNPIDENQVITKASEPINMERSSNLQFVTVGRLSEEKGFMRLIKIFNILKSKGYEFNLWIIGDGPEKNKLKKYIEDNNLNKDVVLLGQQENPHKYTARADVYICSSYTEGYSTACTEAIMLGIPVITTEVSGADEIIREAESGLKIGQTDAEIYDGIKFVLDNPEIIDSWDDILQNTRKRFYAKERIVKIGNILNI